MSRPLSVALTLAMLGAPTSVLAQVKEKSATTPQAVVVGPPVDQPDKVTVPNALVFGVGNTGQGIGSKRGQVSLGNPGLDLYTAHEIRATVANDGKVGIGTGTAAPRTKLDVRGPDAAIELRNTNDGGRGGIVQNTFGSVQMGMFAEQNGAGQVPNASKRAFFGYDTNGKVGSLTNSMTAASPPAFRNVLDDGQGNAKIAGNISARNLPFVVYKHEVAGSLRGGWPMAKCSSFDVYEVVVEPPGPGVIVVNGFVSLGGVGRAGAHQCEQKSTAQQFIDAAFPPERNDTSAGRFTLLLNRIVDNQTLTVSRNSRELARPDTFGGERWDVSYVLPVTGTGKVVFRMQAHNYTSIGMNEKSLVAMYFPLR